jgi:hypothetical protein
LAVIAFGAPLGRVQPGDDFLGTAEGVVFVLAAVVFLGADQGEGLKEFAFAVCVLVVDPAGVGAGFVAAFQAAEFVVSRTLVRPSGSVLAVGGPELPSVSSISAA